MYRNESTHHGQPRKKWNATFPYIKAGPDEMRGDSKRKQRQKTHFTT